MVGWTVPEQPTGLILEPAVGELGVRWNEVTALGTGMPVDARIRWRTAEIGEPGLPDHVEAGSWWQSGLGTHAPTSHTITNLDHTKLYEVQVSAESPMGRSEWSRSVMGKTVRKSDDDSGESAAARQGSNSRSHLRPQ